jgi:succinyl-CoA synthetase beta subunit
MNIEKELYLGMTIEGSMGISVVIVSSEGGCRDRRDYVRVDFG